MEHEQSQQDKAQQELRNLQTIIDKLVEEEKKTRQEIQELRQQRKLIDKKISELVNPKQGGD